MKLQSFDRITRLRQGFGEAGRIHRIAGNASSRPKVLYLIVA
jgi:hypothetical protein